MSCLIDKNYYSFNQGGFGDRGSIKLYKNIEIKWNPDLFNINDLTLISDPIFMNFIYLRKGTNFILINDIKNVNYFTNNDFLNFSVSTSTTKNSYIPIITQSNNDKNNTIKIINKLSDLSKYKPHIKLSIPFVNILPYDDSCTNEFVFSEIIYYNFILSENKNIKNYFIEI